MCWKGRAVCIPRVDVVVAPALAVRRRQRGATAILIEVDVGMSRHDLARGLEFRLHLLAFRRGPCEVINVMLQVILHAVEGP